MRTRLIADTLCVLAVTISWSQSARAEQVRTIADADVVVLALESSEQSDELTFRRLIQRGAGIATSRTLIDVQMEIVRKTIAFGPVLLVLPDDATGSALMSNCGAYDLCEAFADGRVRTGVVPHDSPWIRDYGPFIESAAGGTARVVDTNYDDKREEASVVEALRYTTAKREDTLKHIRKIIDGEPGDRLEMALGGHSEAEAGAQFESLQRELVYWRELADVVREKSKYNERRRDDTAPFGIASLLMSGRPFSFETTSLIVDGGNLMKLDDGACLTTRGVYQHNPSTPGSVLPEVARLFQCREVILLEALPGQDVIDHVDMFVLPAGGKKLVLPDYSLTQNHIVSSWPTMDERLRDLTTQAAIAMAKNIDILRRRGYEVVTIPGLPPRLTDEADLYYPTALNALVRSNGTRRQVLVPRYGGYQEAVQNEGIEIIRAQFGGSTDVETIESTVAAEGQGAIHCLTITAPLAASVFDTSDDSGKIRATLDQRQLLEQGQERLQNPNLVGNWHVRRVGSTATNDVDFQVVFDERRIQIQLESTTVSGAYTLLTDAGSVKDSSRRWPIEITFDKSKGSKTHARVDWMTDRQAVLILEDGDTFWLIKERPIADFATEQRAIELGKKLEGLLADSDERDERGARVQAWTFTATAGLAVSFLVSSDDFAPELVVVGPGLEQPLKGERMETLKMALVTTVIPENGEYKVVVRAPSAKDLGAFTLWAERDQETDEMLSEELLEFLQHAPVRKDAIRIGSRASGQITQDTSEAPTQSRLDAWSLGKCDGGRVRVSVTSATLDTLLMVLGTTMETPLINDDETDESSDSLLEFDCEKAANYKVFAGSLDGETGAYEIRVEKAKKR